MFDSNLHRRAVRVPLNSQNPEGEKIQLSVVDAGSRRALETMVFVHGFGGRAAYWAQQMVHFQDFYRVIALDLRGHGMSDAPETGYDVEQLVDDIEAALEQLEVSEKFILVSHSFGGALATRFIERHPASVQKWVVIGSPVRFVLRWTGRLVLRLPVPVLSTLRRLWSRAALYPQAHVVHAQNRDALSTWDSSAVLPHIQTPTLIIRGARDFLFENKYFSLFKTLMPHAEEVVISVSAHQVMVERPDAVNRAMDRFLGGIDWRATHAKRIAYQRHLEQMRPWVKWYDSRTPPEIRPPLGSATRYLEISAKRFAKNPALTFYRRSISYAQLDRLSNRFANGLKRAGIVKGERVVIALAQTPQAVIAYYGALKAGAVVVFADERHMSMDAVFARVQEVEAKVLLLLSTRHKEAQATLARIPGDVFTCKIYYSTYREYMAWSDWLLFSLLKHYRLGHRMPWTYAMKNKRVSDADNVHYFFELMSLQNRAPEIEPSVDDVALIQYSSGSRARAARGAVMTHGALATNALQMRHWLPESRPGEERILCGLSFAHTYGFISGLSLAPLLGANLVLLSQFEPLKVARAIRRYRPTIFPAVPEMYRALAYTPGIRKYGIASIRVCTSAGQPLPLEIQETFEKLTRGRVIEVYGLAEAGAVLATPLSARRRYASMGVPLPSTEAKIVHTETRAALGYGQVGELLVRGAQMMQGYLSEENGEENAHEKVDGVPPPVFEDDWFATGDLAWQDEDGFFYFADKLSLSFMSQGKRVYPREIEEIIYEHPLVAEAAVVFSHSQDKSPVISAYIVPSSDQASTEGALQDWINTRLPSEKHVHRVIFLGRIPRTAGGQVDTVRLVEAQSHSLADFLLRG